MADIESSKAIDFSIVTGGPTYHLFHRLRLLRPPLYLARRRILVITAFTWLPLFVLSLSSDEALHRVTTPYLLDVATQARFLLALPLLLAGELSAQTSLRRTVLQFIERDLIPKEELHEIGRAHV